MPLSEMFRIDKSIKTENRLVVVQGWGGGGWGITANKSMVSFEDDENVLKLDYRDGCTNL